MCVNHPLCLSIIVRCMILFLNYLCWNLRFLGNLVFARTLLAYQAPYCQWSFMSWLVIHKSKQITFIIRSKSKNNYIYIYYNKMHRKFRQEQSKMLLHLSLQASSGEKAPSLAFSLQTGGGICHSFHSPPFFLPSHLPWLLFCIISFFSLYSAFSSSAPLHQINFLR
jgi:hypothetical protein